MSPASFQPRVTVAAVVERDGRFLCVEEAVDGRRVWNQPAGHVEAGEDLVEAAVRETLEETGLPFAPATLVGVYLWDGPAAGPAFLRVAFAGTVADGRCAPRDPDILGAAWLTRAELAACTTRSPLVLRCVDDWLAGARHPLAALHRLR